MTQIILDDQQAKTISEAGGLIELLDRHGRSLGVISTGISAEDIAIAKARSAANEQKHSTHDVLNHLNSFPTK